MMKGVSAIARFRVARAAIYGAGFAPAAWTFYLGVIDQLGADPMKTLEQTLGLWALRFLIVTLAISPARDLFGLNLLRYRRTVGLLCFYYALMHLLTYVVLDQGSISRRYGRTFSSGHTSLSECSALPFWCPWR